MITTLVQLLIAFPKLAELFFKVKDGYVEEVKRRRHARNSASIDDFMRDSKTNSDS